MDPPSWLQFLAQTPLSIAIQRSTWAVMGLEAVHLIGLALLGGAILLVGLPELRREQTGGLDSRSLLSGTRGMLVAGLAFMLVSGALITLSSPSKYFYNDAFRWKMLLLALALPATLNLRRTARAAPVRGWRRRVLAVLVLSLWLGVGLSGRLIGFL